MLGTMRRREDDLLAISPPPEFQDLSPGASSSASVTPPRDFRDLTPSPSCPETRGLFPSISISETGNNTKTKLVREFAEKISFNILNEAMIIATLIPQAGVTDSDFTTNHLSVPTRGGTKFNSDSYDSSSATSWEYLHEVEDLTSFIKPFPLPPLLGRRFQKRSLRKSYSESVALKSVSEISRTEKSPLTMSGPGFSQCNNSVAQLKRNFLMGAETDRHDILTKDESSRTPISVDDSDCYRVPFECDIYSLPVDNIPNPKESSSVVTMPPRCFMRPRSHRDKEQENSKRSLGASESHGSGGVTSSTHETSRGVKMRNSQRQKNNQELTTVKANKEIQRPRELPERNNNEEHGRSKKKRRSKSNDPDNQESQNRKSSPSQALTKAVAENTEKEKRTLGSSFLNLFRRTRPKMTHVLSEFNNEKNSSPDILRAGRALPLPPIIADNNESSFPGQDESLSLHMHSALEPQDFATRIEKVKDCGWYWGPLSSQGAEDLLRGEPDGSFIVRDSSDVHYIFSLTFKLNGLIRHVRIEHDQGNFSFGPLTRFKAATIVDFVEKAVAHSRSGRYLFFLHRRPILGPMRVQLLHPYSRYRHPRSLQHMCRFVILKHVRRDLVNCLPLPNPLLDYLNTPQYYFENKREEP